MQEKLFIDSKAGKVCCVYTEIANSTSIVIISHGFLSNKSSRTGVALAEKLHQNGISIIALDLYGHGESEGNLEELTVSKAVDNVLEVYAFVTSKGYTKIGLVGSSFSGEVSLLVATKRPITVLSLKCPVFDYAKLWEERIGIKGIEKWKKDGFVLLFEKRILYETYADAKKYDMKKLVPLIHASTLVIHGDKDATVPQSHPEEIINLISSKEKKLEIIHGADHFFYGPLHFKKMIEFNAMWLSKYLQ